MMMSDLRRDYFVTRLATLDAGAGKGIEAAFAEAETQARGQFAAEGIATDQVKLLRYGKFRYQNQEHTVEVPLSGLVSDTDLAQISTDFHAAYEKEYTYRLNAPVEMVGLHIVATAEVGKLTMTPAPLSGADAAPAKKGKRTVDYALDGIHTATIYDGTRLAPGMKFEGPAVVEDPGTTIVIHPGNRVSIDGFRNLHIEL
jgi:N-methylhydantoinase A